MRETEKTGEKKPTRKAKKCEQNGKYGDEGGRKNAAAV